MNKVDVERISREIVTAAVTDGFRIRDNGLEVFGNPTYEQWYAFGIGLSRDYSRIQWAIGDWINEGEKRYGEMYAQALDSHIYNYGTLRNYASIAARIPKEVRNSKLRFHQSKYVAPLEPDEQKRILDFAADKNLSGDDIQEIVNKTLGRVSGNRTETGQESDSVIQKAVYIESLTAEVSSVNCEHGVILLIFDRAITENIKSGLLVNVTITEIPAD